MGALKRVFCVDDDKQVTQVLKYVLKKLGYRQCGVAHTAAAAIDGIVKTRPDIVLVDIELNGKLEGLDIADFLVSKMHIPFVYLSGHDDPEILYEARKIVPNGYLFKPFDCRKLQVALNAVQSKGEV